MHAGETTILLRARHAPLEPLPATPAARHSPFPSSTGALRRFRMVRPRAGPVNGVPLTNGHHPPEQDVKLEVKPEVKTDAPPPAKVKKEEDYKNGELSGNGTWTLGSQLRRLLELQPRLASGTALVQRALSTPRDGGDEASTALAAAIIQRAVLLCRAHLYSGLHTIIPPTLPAPPPPVRVKQECKQERDAECAWCLRRYSARRCLWYGPPLRTPPERRAWRRERGRRYLCACCGEHGEEPGGEADGEGAGGVEGGGWYGKGYRKGRRKRR